MHQGTYNLENYSMMGQSGGFCQRDAHSVKVTNKRPYVMRFSGNI